MRNEMMKKIEKMETAVAEFAAKALVKTGNAVREWKQEERGASDLVTALVLIVIVIGVAALFKTQLVKIVNAIGSKVMSWISSN